MVNGDDNKPKSEIVKGQEAHDLLSLPEQLDAALAVAEKRIEVRLKLLKLAIGKVLLPTDIVDFGGKPYIQCIGCDRLVHIFGIHITDIQGPFRESITDDKGTYTVVNYKGTFTLPKFGLHIEMVGRRTTRDKFFKDPDTEEDVQQSAYTNLIENGVTRLLGIRGLSWKELETLGFTRGQAGGHVEFKGKTGEAAKAAAQTQSQGSASEKPAATATGAASNGAKREPGETKIRDEFIAGCQKLYDQVGWGTDGWRKNAFSVLITGHWGKIETFSTEHLGQIYDALAKVADGSKPVRFEGEKTKEGGFRCVWVEEPAAEADMGTAA